MFEQVFKNVDDVLWKEAGCTTELDYTEQTSWLLFLKYLDGLEQDRAAIARMEGKSYSYILDRDYRWEVWAAPKKADGSIEKQNVMIGTDLVEFVNGKLFPYLQGFKQKATGPNTLEYKIGEIFAEIKNKIHSGYNLREIIERGIQDMEDYYLAADVLARVRDGKEQVHSAADMRRDLGLDERIAGLVTRRC